MGKRIVVDGEEITVVGEDDYYSGDGFKVEVSRTASGPSITEAVQEAHRIAAVTAKREGVKVAQLRLDFMHRLIVNTMVEYEANFTVTVWVNS